MMSGTVGVGETAGVSAPAAPPPRGLDLSTTPGKLRLVLAVLVLLSMAWGALAALTANHYATAASSVVAAREPLSLDALHIYQNLSDANDTAATAFLIGGLEPDATRQLYLADIAAAGSGIQDATARGGTASGAAARDLGTLSAGLTVYAGEIETARADNRLGLPLGAAYLREASGLMRDTLLPAARDMYAAENASLTRTSAQSTGLPLIAVTLGIGVGAGAALYLASSWLRRRTNRVLNPGLAAAMIAVAVSVIWLAAACTGGRGDLLTAQALGSVPQQALAKVSLAAQQAHSDESLTLIDNSGDDSYQQDFLRLQRSLGPGRATLLTVAASEGGPGAADGQHLPATARTWFTAHAALRALDDAGKHAQAVRSALGTETGNAGAAYGSLAAEANAAIDVDQQAFDAHARAASRAYTLLAPGVIVAALIMAIGCAWGLNRRIAEYR